MRYKTFEIKAVAIDRDIPYSDVPCHTIKCTECCEKLSPFLTPEEFASGKYIYTLIDAGDTQKPAIAIPRTEHGCVYLDHNKQCAIYDIRPKACRQFDCRLNHSPVIENKFKEIL